MIALFTDFGSDGPYTGQMKAVLWSQAPGQPVIDLFADVPPSNAKAAAYLLAAYGLGLTGVEILLCVVDPGVGSVRRALCVEAGGQWYVGPDNGTFEHVIRAELPDVTVWEILWRPGRLSSSFHGRDVFAPVAARLTNGEQPRESADFKLMVIDQVRRTDWPDILAEVVYIDHFGNAMCGIRCSCIDPAGYLEFDGRQIYRAETFSSVSPGEAFCYENSNGLLEIAINQGRADEVLGLAVGTPVTLKKCLRD